MKKFIRELKENKSLSEAFLAAIVLGIWLILAAIPMASNLSKDFEIDPVAAVINGILVGFIVVVIELSLVAKLIGIYQATEGKQK